MLSIYVAVAVDNIHSKNSFDYFTITHYKMTKAMPTRTCLIDMDPAVPGTMLTVMEEGQRLSNECDNMSPNSQ